MRFKFSVVIALVVVFSAVSWAANLQIVPTTTVQAETSNNTSAANSFKAQTNGNLGAGNVSKVDIHSLALSGRQYKDHCSLHAVVGRPAAHNRRLQLT